MAAQKEEEEGGGRSVNPKKELLGRHLKTRSPACACQPSSPLTLPSHKTEKPFLGRFYFLLLFFRVFRTKPGK